ncbi:MAG TPA: nuclear transport factor 2 family protein [Pyrinomonadaceae bacterium]|nr:nuclear transport factor 2 family protein [Pyrinomonadaceae bacterium]
MILFFKCLILISLLPGVSQKPARETRESRDIKELTRLESVWNEAHLRGDAPTLDKLWAEDLFVTVPDMAVMNKEESLAVWKSGKMKFDIYKTSDLRIRVYGDSAVVTGQLVRIRDANSKEFEDDWRFTKVYVRRQGKWLAVAWHGSHVGSP